MPDEYLTVARDADVEIEEKRSRFLARVRRVEDEAAARAVIEQCRKQYWDARHHCSAFALGPSAAIARSNDDGEPSGTAGAPILASISGREISDVVVVVTRYFGGTLLGAGGLVRAYGEAAAAGLERAGSLRRTRALTVEASVPLTDIGRVENALRNAGLEVDAVEYGGVELGGVDYAGAATIRGRIVPGGEAELRALLGSLTSGRASLRVTGSAWTDPA